MTSNNPTSQWVWKSSNDWGKCPSGWPRRLGPLSQLQAEPLLQN